MPCLDISTNVSLDGVDTDSIFSEATKAVASIIGKPENVISLSLMDLLANRLISSLSCHFLPDLQLKKPRSDFINWIH